MYGAERVHGTHVSTTFLGSGRVVEDKGKNIEPDCNGDRDASFEFTPFHKMLKLQRGDSYLPNGGSHLLHRYGYDTCPLTSIVLF